MSENASSEPTARGVPGWAQPRIWHFVLLVLFVAIAITDIREQRIQEPVLIGLAAGGLIVYGLIGWIAWWAVSATRLVSVRCFCLSSTRSQWGCCSWLRLSSISSLHTLTARDSFEASTCHLIKSAG